MDKAERATLTVPPALSSLPPLVATGDRAATLVFLAEALKPKATGKGTSTAELSTTGVWSERDPREATAEQGRQATEAFVDAAVRFIERWKQLRPMQRQWRNAARSRRRVCRGALRLKRNVWAVVRDTSRGGSRS
jgi:hypothetical protein